jgi:hypothetical protein
MKEIQLVVFNTTFGPKVHFPFFYFYHCTHNAYLPLNQFFRHISNQGSRYAGLPTKDDSKQTSCSQLVQNSSVFGTNIPSALHDTLRRENEDLEATRHGCGLADTRVLASMRAAETIARSNHNPSIGNISVLDSLIAAETGGPGVYHEPVHLSTRADQTHPGGRPLIELPKTTLSSEVAVAADAHAANSNLPAVADHADELATAASPKSHGQLWYCRSRHGQAVLTLELISPGSDGIAVQAIGSNSNSPAQTLQALLSEPLPLTALPAALAEAGELGISEFEERKSCDDETDETF